MNKAKGFRAQLDKVSAKGEQKPCLTAFPRSSFRHYSEYDSHKTETPKSVRVLAIHYLSTAD